MNGQRFHGHQGLAREERPQTVPQRGRSCGVCTALPLQPEDPAAHQHRLSGQQGFGDGLPAAWLVPGRASLCPAVPCCAMPCATPELVAGQEGGGGTYCGGENYTGGGELKLLPCQEQGLQD